MNRQQRFYSTMQKGLGEMNVSGNDNLKSIYPQKLETKYGPLLIHVEENENSRTATTYACYARFMDVEKARDHVDCNPYSGKWNFHFSVKNTEPEDAAGVALERIKKII